MVELLCSALWPGRPGAEPADLRSHTSRSKGAEKALWGPEAKIRDLQIKREAETVNQGRQLNRCPRQVPACLAVTVGLTSPKFRNHHLCHCDIKRKALNSLASGSVFLSQFAKMPSHQRAGW